MSRVGRGGDALLHDQDDVVLRLEGVVELDEVHVVQLVHDADLVPHVVLAEGGLVQCWAAAARGVHRAALTLSFTPLVLMILAASFRPVAFSSHL